jgi:hypothetical protein
MQDEPHPDEILAAVSTFLRETALPQLSGHTAFLTRVAANAVDLVRRQIALAPGFDAEEQARLKALLGRDGTLEALNRALCDKIERHEIAAETPGLADHLWSTTMAKLAIDQPRYAAYLHALGRNPDEREPGKG